jgi:hypothetical protein
MAKKFREVHDKIDPDRTISWNIDRMIWHRFEEIYPRKVPLYHFTLTTPAVANKAIDWFYHQYVLWYDDLLHNHPVGQLCLADDP